MIRNTTAAMQNPNGIDRDLLLLTGLTTGSPGSFIEAQEKQGQQQLINSTQLPTDLNGNSIEDFTALGFTFGEPDPGDPLFQPATIPDGWRKEASHHDMWSYIVDELGRRRVGVFYKAAFYDRKAHMNLTSMYGYLSECQNNGQRVVSDESWATPQAIVAAAKAHIDSIEGTIALYSRPNVVERDPEYAGKRLAEATAKRNHYAVLAAKYDTVGGAA